MKRNVLRCITAAATVLAAALTTVVGVAEASPGPHVVVVNLPAPTGDYPVGVTDWHVTDVDRNDPWSPGQHRDLMVRIWYPAADNTTPPAPWMPPGAREEQAEYLARLGVLSGTWALGPSHSIRDAAARTEDGRYPILLNSPGMDDAAGLNTAQAEDLASHGYIVVAINHTHEAFAVQFPDGHTERSVVPLDSPQHVLSDVLLPTRVADVRFVLDELTSAAGQPRSNGTDLPPHLASDLNLSEVGMFGHSLGGSTTMQAMHDDHRIRAGVNLDGPVLGSVATDGLDRPLLMLASDNSPWFGRPGWEPNWATNSGLKIPLRISGTRHMSFTDEQIVLPRLANAGLLDPAETAEAVGSIEPQRSVDLQRASLMAYFDAVFGRTDANIAETFARLAQPEMLPHP